jgi:hypothetical protein
MMVLLTTASLSGCASVPVEPPSTATAAAADESAATSPADADDSPTVRSVPRISGCEQVGAIVSGFIDGMSPEADNAVQDDFIDCAWSTPEASVSSLSDIKTFSVTVEEGTDDVPNVADSEAMGFTDYFSDPRLDAIGGVGIFSDADNAAVGAGVGSVSVPGVDVTISSSQWGQDDGFDKEDLVTIALKLLDL